jgi:hypothetical protein
MPEMGRLAPFLREERKVGRDGYVQWEGAWYGVPWSWAGKAVEVMATDTTVEIWVREDRLAVHPRARRPGQRFTLPGQWDGLRNGNGRPPKEPLAVQVATVEVERRSLDCYEVAAAGGVR